MDSNYCSEPVSYAAVEEDATGGLVIEVFDDLVLMMYFFMVAHKAAVEGLLEVYEDMVEVLLVLPRRGELRTQKLKSYLMRTPSLNVLPIKPGVGQYIAIHATLTARNFFFAYFYPSNPFTCIFS